MKTIYKYNLMSSNDGYEDTLQLPKGAKILSVISQGTSIFLYAMVDIEETIMKRVGYKVYCTGQEIDEYVLDEFNYYRFLGTVTMYDTSLVFHVYIDD